MPSFSGGGYAYKEEISSPIDYNNGIIITAKLTATLSATGVYSLRFWMTADGSNWEEVSNGVAHTFVNTGTDLRWKITGSGPVRVTKLIIGDYH